MKLKIKGLTVLVMIAAMCALVASASAQPDNHSSDADTGWMERYAPYREITSLRDYCVKHFDLGNGERVAVVGQGLLHYYDGEKFEDIPDLPFPEGIELVDEKDEHYIMCLPDWCTARVEDECRVVRCYDKKNTSIYEFKDLVVVAKGMSPYKKIVGSDGEEKTVIDEEKVDYCKFNVKDNKMYLVVPENLSNTYPLQAYDDVDTSATNNKDSFLLEEEPEESCGGDSCLFVAATDNERWRIVMDWTLPGGTGDISAIKLFLYKCSNETSTSYNVEVHEILESPFVESEVTWNERSSGVSWTDAGCGSPNSSSSTIVDSIPRTTSINEWHTWWLVGSGADNPMGITWGSNVYITLRESAGTGATINNEEFYSKEHTDTSLRPYIEITYSAAAPPSPSAPFMIYGWVNYSNGTACNNPTVNINNTNTSNNWSADTNASYNYYQLMLVNGTDVNVSEILRFNVTDGSVSNITNHTVTSDDVNDGGLFNFNITLEALIHDINVSTEYYPEGNGIKIKDAVTNDWIPVGQNLTRGKSYKLAYQIVNNGNIDEENVNITVNATNGTTWNKTIREHDTTLSIGQTKTFRAATWDTSELAPGNYNVTVNASIPVDNDWSNNERTRQVTLESPTAPAIADWYNNKTKNNSTGITINESECVLFNATADQAIDVWSWFVNGLNQSHNFDNFSYCGWTVNGTYYVEVNGTNANGTSNTVNWTVTVNDITPPTVVDYTPTGTNVPVTTNITANFSEAMNSSTLNTGTILVENSSSSMIEGDITYNSTTKTVTFGQVSSLEYNETYNVTITTGVQDLAGNNMSSNCTWNFTTVTQATVSIAAISVALNESITVPIMVSNVTNLGSGTINVTYNSSVVHATSVASGTGNALEVQSWNISNTIGFVQIVAWDANESHNGIVIFANVTYKAVGNETEVSPLNITVEDLTDWDTYTDILNTTSNGTFTIIDTSPPLVTNPTATPDTIPNNGTVCSQLNVTVTDASSIASVTINLSSIGGSSVQPMTNIPDTNIWNVTKNATTGYGLQNLTVNATDIFGYYNTSASITLNITDSIPPEYEWISRPTAGNTSESVLVNVSATDNIGVTVYNITIDGVNHTMNNNGHYYTYDIPIPSNSTADINYNCTFVDAAGNSNITETVTITVTDNDAPILTLSLSRPIILNNHSQGRARPPGTNQSRLNVTAIDNIPNGIANNKVTINQSAIGGQPAHPIPHIPGTDMWWMNLKALTHGCDNLTNTLTVTATDNAGNSNTSTINLTVLKRGNVVRDNEVDVGDAFHIAKYLVGKESLSELDKFVADVVPAAEHNGITSGDALYIAKKVVGKEPEP